MPKITSDLGIPFARGEYIYIIKTQLLFVCLLVCPDCIQEMQE